MKKKLAQNSKICYNTPVNKRKETNKMNNFVMLIAAIMTLFIAFVQCFNPEDMALFGLACVICGIAIVMAIVGIILDKDFFE